VSSVTIGFTIVFAIPRTAAPRRSGHQPSMSTLSKSQSAAASESALAIQARRMKASSGESCLSLPSDSAFDHTRRRKSLQATLLPAVISKEELHAAYAVRPAAVARKPRTP
jgi:hypothetical protein